MKSLFHRREIFALHIFASIDVLKKHPHNIFCQQNGIQHEDRVLIAVATKKMLFSSIDYENLKNI